MKEVASKVKARAQELMLEVFRVSMMMSLEKNPERNGVPVSARLPNIKQEAVIGVTQCIPPIFRRSCSFLRL